MFSVFLILFFVINVYANSGKKLHDRIIDENSSQFEQVKKSLDFTGKVALVTGSNSGIGAETVRLLSYLGAQVVVTGRDVQRVGQVAKQCHKLSPYNYMPLGVAADLTHNDVIKELIDQTIQTYRKIDILVNCAGIGKSAKFLAKNFSEVLSEVTLTNEMSAIEVTRLAIPYLRQTNGTVIFIASYLATSPLEGSISYGMSKAALVLLTKALSQELGPNIRVNAISPGLILNTRIYRPSVGPPEELINKTLSETPLGRTGVPLDVAKGVAFLASPLAEWIGGINLAINGGIP